MGDEIVDAVHQTLIDVGYANGVEIGALHPIADAIVNRLRASGMEDFEIKFRLVDDEEAV